MENIKNTRGAQVVGGGLAGSEAAWQLANAGVPVTLYEMRPKKMTKAHKGEHLAELVCSNSFRSDDDAYNAVGLLHWEMRQMNSLIMQMADKHKVPAGSALAIDRDHFSQDISNVLKSHPLITLCNEEITELPTEENGPVIIATGPLTSDPLAESIRKVTGEDSLAFFDALAPIIHKDSINFDVAWYQSRYDKGDGKDYINCPMNKEQYETFLKALLESEKTEFKEWEMEKSCGYFEGCMPIEVMAERGPETLRYGPMKPVGLTNPNSTEKPYAVVQLRQDNKLGTLYNIVGFQTKMKYGAQKEVFRLIPGLEKAVFARMGGIHRNTFINSPKLLDEELRLKKLKHIRFSGQITGCEGYVESAAIGMIAGLMTAHEFHQKPFIYPLETTSCGALLNHITKNAHADTFQPMNVNFGLFPPPEQTRDERGKKIKGRDRKKLYTDRAKKDFLIWMQTYKNNAA